MFLGVCDEILINLNPFGFFPTALIAKISGPLNGSEKNSSDYRVYGTQTGFEIFAPSPEILAKMYPNLAFQAVVLSTINPKDSS